MASHNLLQKIHGELLGPVILVLVAAHHAQVKGLAIKVWKKETPEVLNQLHYISQSDSIAL